MILFRHQLLTALAHDILLAALVERRIQARVYLGFVDDTTYFDLASG